MIYGTGIDIVRIKRIEKTIDRWKEKFIRRIFTENEIIYCQNKTNPASHFAVRFAAKEAAAKMFGTGIGKINWTDIRVVNNKTGKPYLNFEGEAQNLYNKKGIKSVHLSLSHEKEYAVAQVIAEGGQ